MSKMSKMSKIDCMKLRIWKKLNRGIAAALCLTMMILLVSCGNGAEKADGNDGTAGDDGSAPVSGSLFLDPAAVSGSLVYDHSLELDYAKEFTVDYFQDGYALLSISDGTHYLLVPEDGQVPEDLNENVTPLQMPIENTYLVASAVMDMYVSLDAVDALGFSALKADSWYVEEARTAMEEGTLVYAGKYSAPDYELILSKGCGLAIENTMIFHTPEIKEQLEKFGIPVLVDYSSYETTPQGRMEWVKLYGALTGKEEAAKAVFDEQVAAIEKVSENEKQGKTIAFFYITSSGGVNVRKSSDYLPKMIELAGGAYIFEDLGDKDNMASSTMTMQMEDFYAAARDADYLVYNSSIEGELSSMDDFLAESTMLEKFKAVEEGHVYCTTKNLYQASMELGTMISDFYYMMAGEDSELTYLYRLK